MKKRLAALLLAGLLTVLMVLPGAAAVPERPADAGLVNDFAGVLSSKVRDQMAKSGRELEERAGPSVVLVTVDFTDGADIGDYALELFNSWGIGDEDRKDGLLILMSIGDDDYWVLQGFGLEDVLTAGDIQQILDTHMRGDFDAKDYDAAALNTYQAFTEQLSDAAAGGETTADNDGVAAGSWRYVYDETGLLSEGTVRYLETLGEDTRQRVGASVTVALVQAIGDTDAERERYADRLFEQIGLDGNSVLFVMGVDDGYYVRSGEYVANVVTVRRMNTIFDDYTDAPYMDYDFDTAARDTAGMLSNLLLHNLESGGGAAAGKTSGGGFFNALGSFILSVMTLAVIAVLVVALAVMPRRRYYRGYYGVPYNPFAPRYVRRYGPGGYWGRWGGPRPGFHSYPPPHPPYGHRRRPPGGQPPMGGAGGSAAGTGRPVGGGASKTAGAGRGRNSASSGGSFGSGSSGSSGSAGRGRPGGSSSGGTFGGGSSRGGGAGRSGSSWGGSSSGRSSGGFGGGASRGGGGSFGGGSSRGGGAGRGRR